MAKILIYDERYPKQAKGYASKKEAVNAFLNYHSENNTSFDGKEFEEIEREISLHEIAGEYYGSWGRVEEVLEEEEDE